MSRLYMKFNSDMRETTIHARAHEYINGVILWGDKNNPKKACEILVSWRKGDEKPTVKLFDYTEED